MSDEDMARARRIEITAEPHESEPREPIGDYKYIEEVDDAIIAILGYDPWIGCTGGFSGERGNNRVIHLDRAAGKAFFERRPEDEYTAVLRKANADLQRDGKFRPSVAWSRYG